jgi:hypothetical protein
VSIRAVAAWCGQAAKQPTATAPFYAHRPAALCERQLHRFFGSDSGTWDKKQAGLMKFEKQQRVQSCLRHWLLCH